MSIASDNLSAEFEARFQQAPTAKVDEKELARWRELCREAIAERDRLRGELAEVAKERDYFRKCLLAQFAQQPISFTKEEVMACRGQHPPLRELLEEFERQETDFTLASGNASAP